MFLWLRRSCVGDKLRATMHACMQEMRARTLTYMLAHMQEYVHACSATCVLAGANDITCLSEMRLCLCLFGAITLKDGSGPKGVPQSASSSAEPTLGRPESTDRRSTDAS